MKNSKQHIETVISETFKTLQKVYNSQQESFNGPKQIDTGSRLLFPSKRNEDTRISEQELRFVFVEQLNKEIQSGWDVFYSIETPTKASYSGFSTGNPNVDEKGRSAEVDLCIHDNRFGRIALIEFKAHNPREEDYLKDLYELSIKEEEGELRYFINILKNADNGTIKSINEKIKAYLNCDIIFKFWSLESKGYKDVTEDIINYQS